MLVQVAYTRNEMLPPTIPTSFVPHTSRTDSHRFDSDLSGAFGFFAYIILGCVFALALGVFFYGRILANQQSVNDIALAKAEAAIDVTTVENFVRLRNRLDSGATLLANHNAFSGFFTLLGKLMPSTVRFTSLHLTFNETKEVKIDGLGFAKSFNALAAASTAFATDGHIKDAVFSNIVVSARDSSVSFALTAMLDPKVIAFSPSVTTTSDAELPQGNSSTTPSL